MGLTSQQFTSYYMQRFNLDFKQVEQLGDFWVMCANISLTSLQPCFRQSLNFFGSRKISPCLQFSKMLETNLADVHALHPHQHSLVLEFKTLSDFLFPKVAKQNEPKVEHAQVSACGPK
jgi:hypothetical protein